MRDRRMIVGLRLDRIPLEDLGEAASLAETARLDFVLTGDPDALADEVVGHDALSIASYLMTKTTQIGLVATVPLNWAPYNVARALASMDRLSGGRCGWWPVPGAPEGERNVAREAEHLDVVLQLFDSWDDDALLLDKAASVFADRTKVRRIRHAGEHFTVDGPLNAPRPLQGHPVMFGPLSSGPDALVLQTLPLDLKANPSRTLEQQMAAASADDACGGCLLNPASLSDIAAFVRDTVPTLQAHGLLQTDYADGDFRTRLGLSRPANRFTSAASLTGAAA